MKIIVLVNKVKNLCSMFFLSVVFVGKCHLCVSHLLLSRWWSPKKVPLKRCLLSKLVGNSLNTKFFLKFDNILEEIYLSTHPLETCHPSFLWYINYVCFYCAWYFYPLLIWLGCPLVPCQVRGSWWWSHICWVHF